MSTALLFPGQGSQQTLMGRELAEADRDIMNLWKQAERISGIALREIYWGGGETDMAQTRNLQPALTVVNFALWQKLSSKMTPTGAAGHSLGEYSALAAAGVLPFAVILDLVSLRGRLMSEADPEGKGAMTAVVKMSLEQVEECVAAARKDTGEPLVVANYNTPAQFVVSGTRAAIADVQAKVKEAKGRALPLSVSGAFHSPLMNEAAEELAKALDSVAKTAWNNARFPVYCNASPKAETDSSVIKKLLAEQMTSSVFWIDTIARQWDDGCRLFVECGPKGVLTKMVGPVLLAHAPAVSAHSEENPAWKAINVNCSEHIQSFPA